MAGERKAEQTFVAFNAGEVSRELAARADMEKLRKAAATMENMIVSEYGGTVRRPGLRFVAIAGGSEP